MRFWWLRRRTRLESAKFPPFAAGVLGEVAVVAWAVAVDAWAAAVEAWAAVPQAEAWAVPADEEVAVPVGEPSVVLQSQRIRQARAHQGRSLRHRHCGISALRAKWSLGRGQKRTLRPWRQPRRAR